MKLTVGTLHPTGTCFEDVTNMFAKMLVEKPARFSNSFFLMVHGICLMPDGREYSHAWIEEGNSVWFPVILNSNKGFVKTRRDHFYAHYQVTSDVTRYSARQLIKLCSSNGDVPPPWEERYLKLCRDYKDKK